MYYTNTQLVYIEKKAIIFFLLINDSYHKKTYI